MNELNTNNTDFRKWVWKFYKEEPKKLKPKELLDRFIVYKAWKENAPTTEQKNINDTIRI